MIEIKITHPLDKNHEACTGCAACAAACSVNCISMQPDNEGFLHPQIDTGICTGCDLCRKICPVTSASSAASDKTEGPLHIYAAWHLDETIRHESSSGGIFTALAENILSKGGVVVGAAFDDQLVVRHTIVENTSELHRLRGSKYVQSQLSPALNQQIRDLLRQGRFVLFTGTPCQVAGLKSYLHRSYDNLFCSDLICHGVPSPKLWLKYLEFDEKNCGALAGHNFRSKQFGWKNAHVHSRYLGGRERICSAFNHPYQRAFLFDYAMRTSCYSCKFTNSSRCGDLTIGDFHGVNKKYPEYDSHDKGTSLILVNKLKGQAWLDECSNDLFLGVADLKTAIAGNPMLVRSCYRPPQRDSFYLDLNNYSFEKMIKKYQLKGPSFLRRVVGFLKRKIAAVLRKI